MATEEQIGKAVGSLAEIRACRWCGTRIRFGDWECAHCGADLEDELRQWAQRLVDAILVEHSSSG